MSFPGQSHHPHIPGQPPNQHLFLVGGPGCDGYLPKGTELVQAHVFHRHGERARKSSWCARVWSGGRVDRGSRETRGGAEAELTSWFPLGV